MEAHLLDKLGNVGQRLPLGDLSYVSIPEYLEFAIDIKSRSFDWFSATLGAKPC